MAVVTTNLTHEWIAKEAKLGFSPGNNTDPTSAWIDNKGSLDASLSGFAYNTASGWVGTGTTGDPYALQYDGSNDIVNCGGMIDFNSLSAFTIEAWAYVPASNGASYPRIVSKDDTGTTTGFAFYMSSSAELGAKVMVGSTMWDGNFAGAAATVTTSAWNHLVLTFDSADSYLRAYQDTVACTAESTAAGNVVTSTAPFCIGNRYADLARPWFGAIATVRFYSVALTSTQITQNYNAGITAAWSDSSSTFTGLTVTRLLQG